MATANRFLIRLPVADLARATRFYRLLWKSEPIQQAPDSARFELDQPALSLTITQGEPGRPVSTLNHLGIRMPDAVALVDLQRRLEEAGIATQRQDGVECCYARQTKFWVTDPDKHLWELYIFHEDLDHSGFDDPPVQQPQKSEPRYWRHALTDPIPARLDFADGSIDEVDLEGTFNLRLSKDVQAQLLGEIFRVLRPGGKVAIHGMVGDRPFPGTPAFPGIAALVQSVPAHTELVETLRKARFTSIFLEKFDGVCLSVPGMELREIRVLGTRPEIEDSAENRCVLYRGPFDEVTADDGITFRRGERKAISAAGWNQLRSGPVANQFVFFPAP